MELKKRVFDQTDPFAHPKQLAGQAVRWQAQMKRAGRTLPAEIIEQLAHQAAPPQPMRGSVQAQPSVHISTVEVAAGDGSARQPSPPTVIYRPRRVMRPVPWQLRFEVALIRLAGLVRRSVRRQLRQVGRLGRRLF